MNIIFPPLVEEGYHFYAAKDNASDSLEKSRLYKAMVKKGIITQTGAPTPYAIENGLVKDYYEAENLDFSEFLDLYPIFKSYDAALFKQIDGFWEIPVSFKEDLMERLSEGDLTYDEKVQLQSYILER